MAVMWWPPPHPACRVPDACGGDAGRTRYEMAEPEVPITMGIRSLVLFALTALAESDGAQLIW
ncbi:hypothetical protein [Actinomadura madurae]|uniref:hypothetical protein n=1 Tax=Actinomadura madurae TaxID=1993 RepID=UPI000D88F0B7|nr:Uncharacterised protein [Actinomadura madurae]